MGRSRRQPALAQETRLCTRVLMPTCSAVITMLAYVSSFALIGFGARCYQLALMKRNIFSSASPVLLRSHPD
jgi:hypothetical protein